MGINFFFCFCFSRKISSLSGLTANMGSRRHLTDLKDRPLSAFFGIFTVSAMCGFSLISSLKLSNHPFSYECLLTFVRKPHFLPLSERRNGLCFFCRGPQKRLNGSVFAYKCFLIRFRFSVMPRCFLYYVFRLT